MFCDIMLKGLKYYFIVAHFQFFTFIKCNLSFLPESAISRFSVYFQGGVYSSMYSRGDFMVFVVVEVYSTCPTITLFPGPTVLQHYIKGFKITLYGCTLISSFFLTFFFSLSRVSGHHCSETINPFHFIHSWW